MHTCDRVTPFALNPAEQQAVACFIKTPISALALMAYPQQQLWDSMLTRFAAALLHFTPLAYHPDIVMALQSELVRDTFVR